MTSLLNVVGLIADTIAICNALGIKTPAQSAESDELIKSIEEIHSSTEHLQGLISDAEAKIRNTITTAAVIEMRSRLQKNISVDKDKVDTMLKLLFIIKTVSSSGLCNSYPIFFLRWGLHSWDSWTHRGQYRGSHKVHQSPFTLIKTYQLQNDCLRWCTLSGKAKWKAGKLDQWGSLLPCIGSAWLSIC